jgi:ABC-type dipeptide/oligopeptide/nickel transport system permease component
MTTYIIRRLLLFIPVLLGMTIIVFATVALSPGGTGASLIAREGGMDPRARKAIEEYYNKRYGLKDPLPVQYLRWLNEVSPIGFKRNEDGSRGKFGFKVPDLGESLVRHRPIIDLVKEALPITLLLNVITIPIIYVIAIAAGIRAAQKRGKFADIGMGSVLLGLWSFPQMLAGVLAIGFLASREYVKLFPANGLHDLRSESMPFLPAFGPAGFDPGWLLDMGWHLVLPVLCLCYVSFAFLAKLERGAMLENIALDYVRTARAKGLSERVVLLRHVFRNSLIPLITVAVNILPALLGGAVVIESIFGIDGMGKLTVDAALMHDRELVLSDALVLGFVGIVAYLLADICYVLADPRVSYD